LIDRASSRFLKGKRYTKREIQVKIEIKRISIEITDKLRIKISLAGIERSFDAHMEDVERLNWISC
jgi:hypothetical protein